MHAASVRLQRAKLIFSIDKMSGIGCGVLRTRRWGEKSSYRACEKFPFSPALVYVSVTLRNFCLNTD
jgi:hypothetical protein